jgi:hypothetical protein
MTAATKTRAGEYIYRGFRIKLVDSCGYRAWNIFDDGLVVNTTKTLRAAKQMIDCYARKGSLWQSSKQHTAIE